MGSVTTVTTYNESTGQWSSYTSTDMDPDALTPEILTEIGDAHQNACELVMVVNAANQPSVPE